MVRANEADVGLVTGDVHDRVLAATALADYETCVVVPPAHPAGRAPVGAAEPGRQPAHPDGGRHQPADLRGPPALGRRRRGAGGPWSLDSVEAIKRMIEADLGISLLPEVSVRAEVASGRLHALTLADVPRAHRRMVHRRDKYLSATLRAFLQTWSTPRCAPRNSHKNASKIEKV